MEGSATRDVFVLRWQLPGGAIVRTRVLATDLPAIVGIAIIQNAWSLLTAEKEPAGE